MANDQPRTRYEYMWFPKGHRADDSMKQLNTHGAEGWRVVHFSGMMVLLERPLLSDQDPTQEATT